MPKPMRNLSIAITMALILTACSEPEEPEADQTEPQANASPAEQSEIPPDEARRERVREAMQAYRENRAEGGSETEPQRERQRRLTRQNWWDDERIIAELELDEAQREALQAAADTHRGERVQARQELAGIQRELNQALSDGDSERGEALQEKRERIRRELREAGATWRESVEEVLDDDQVAALREDYPQVLD